MFLEKPQKYDWMIDYSERDDRKIRKTVFI